MEGKVFYITKEKLRELKKEYEELVSSEHHKVMDEDAPKILESEDVNPEFISFQEDIDSLRARIDELKDVLEHHQIIKKPPKNQQGLVVPGAKVFLESKGKKAEFTIVGKLESDPDVGKISNESPLGAVLLGRKVGDEVVVPGHENQKYKIRKIQYHID